MPKAFRTLSKFLPALVVFLLPNLVPQDLSAASGDTLSGSVSAAVSSSGSATSSGSVSFSGKTASGTSFSGSLLKSKPLLPHLVQTGLRAEHNLPEEILGIESRYPGTRVSTVSFIYDDYGTGTDSDFRRSVKLL